MIYEIVNPSDPYTMKSDDQQVAMCACVFLGFGRYALRSEAAELVMPPIGWMSSADIAGWLRDHGIEDLDTYVDGHLPAIADCLDTVLYGGFDDRRQYELALEHITDPAEREEYSRKWHDQRSSLNNIGSAAKQFAARLRETQVVE